MSHFDSLARLRARAAEYDAFEQRVKGLEARASHDWTALAVAGTVAVLLLGMMLWLWWSTREAQAAEEHPLLAKIRYQKLPTSSATRQRLQRAGELMAEGWQALQSEDLQQAARCLELFAKAVELDEMACGWKKEYEASLDKIGDLFTDPEENPEADKPAAKKPDSEAIYHSMLTEAYLVLVLYTVVALYGKASPEAAEDYEVIKTRLDRCVSLQPKNPVPYKLRADWCQRFACHADRDACIRDFEKAIVLTKADKDGTQIRCHGVDPQALRSYLLCYCNFQLGSQMQHKKDYDAAFDRYERVLQHADADFVHLPETHFNLAILTIMKMSEEDNKSAMLAAAVQHYSQGCAAAKRLLRWYPSKSFQASKKTAKQVLTKLSKAGLSAHGAAAIEKKNA